MMFKSNWKIQQQHSLHDSAISKRNKENTEY